MDADPFWVVYDNVKSLKVSFNSDLLTVDRIKMSKYAAKGVINFETLSVCCG